MKDTLVKNGTFVTGDGERKADLLIENGVISSIQSTLRSDSGQAINNPQSTIEIIDAAGLLVFPGLIDCHVHFREPGLTQKATMATESAAALAGGITTVCEMPNTSPPTVTVDAFGEKVRLTNNLPIDIRFFFGATEESHLENLRTLFTDSSLADLRARCSGLKLYFDHSTGNQGADRGLIEKAFALCAELGIVAVCHCEDADINYAAGLEYSIAGDVTMHSRMRPAEAERKAVSDGINLARKYGTRFHVAHLSTKGALDLVRKAKKEGLEVTCEVAPHHLLLSTDDYAHLGGFGKMNPPLRSSEHVDALWAGIKDGTVDCIATDHAPHTLEEKTNPDLTKVPSGVPGVETMLPLLLTAAAGKSPIASHTLGIADILRLCFTNPNEIFGLGKKGLMEGAPADLILVDPKAAWTIRGTDLHGKTKWTPYEGREVRGKVIRIIR